MPFPAAITPVGHVEPVPRRIRAQRHGQVVVDTVAARYTSGSGPATRSTTSPGTTSPTDSSRPRTGGHHQPGHRPARARFADVGPQGPAVARVLVEAIDPERWPTPCGSTGRRSTGGSRRTSRSSSVIPASYTRVDALRSTRTVRIELDGVVLAGSDAPVMVFETGLPVRYYLNLDRAQSAALQSQTHATTRCPYKGTTTGYWSVVLGGVTHPDLAWSYDFPTLCSCSPSPGRSRSTTRRSTSSSTGSAEERPATHSATESAELLRGHESEVGIDWAKWKTSSGS